MIKIIKAFVIGISFVIPGLCSATTAIGLNEYEHMLEVIGNFYKIKVIKKHLLLIVGVFIGVLSGILLLKVLFDKYAFFLLSAFLVFNVYSIKIDVFSVKNLFFNLIGIGIVVFFTKILITINFESSLIYLIFGIIVALGFVLPGLSGSLIMLNLGLYNLIFEIISTKDFFNDIILFFTLGLFLGVVLWSKLFSKLIEKQNYIFKSIISGMVYGSIYLLGENVVKLIDDFSKIIFILIICIFLILIIKRKGKCLRKNE